MSKDNMWVQNHKLYGSEIIGIVLKIRGEWRN
jgi:hypothetical protein